MDNREIAIKVSGVKKSYRLGVIGGRTLQEELQSWWALKHGREDPNVRIGTGRSKAGETFMALDGIDFTVYRGERVGIIGNNGAGKSTLLKLLSRITAPTEGEIDVWGRISSVLEIGTGFHREMTGRENIYMNGAILGMSKSEIDSKIDRIISFSEVEEFIDTPVKRYSSGMFVKLAFAVSAYLDSEILVMDEVLAVGDMAFQHKCLDKMRESADTEGKTILYVSHNMETIRRLCSRCIVLNKGKIIFDGSPEQGIAVYMNHNCIDNAVDIDLTETAGREFGVRMERLVLCDKDTPSYRNGEPLKIRLSFSVEQPMRGLSFRMTFRNKEDTGIGTSWSAPADFLEPGGYDALLEMPLFEFGSGEYYISFGAYRDDEIGRKIMVSHITRAMKVGIQGSPVWNTAAYGYIKLTDTEIKEISRRAV